MTRKYETTSLAHRELRDEFEMSILKQIKDTLKKINKM